MALLRIANLVSCGMLLMTSIIRFGYLSGNFITGFFFQCLYIVLFIAVLIASEGGLGLSNQNFIRTYFNLLDLTLGRGLYMLFLCILLFERCSKSEELFPIICTVIACVNIIVGYNDSTQALPENEVFGPKAEQEDIENRKSKKESDKAAELNKLKKEVEKEQRRKKYLEDSSESEEDGKSKKSKKKKSKSKKGDGSSSSDSSTSSDASSERSEESDEGYEKNHKWEDTNLKGVDKKKLKAKMEKKIAKEEKKRFRADQKAREQRERDQLEKEKEAERNNPKKKSKSKKQKEIDRRNQEEADSYDREMEERRNKLYG